MPAAFMSKFKCEAVEQPTNALTEGMEQLALNMEPLQAMGCDPLLMPIEQPCEGQAADMCVVAQPAIAMEAELLQASPSEEAPHTDGLCCDQPPVCEVAPETTEDLPQVTSSLCEESKEELQPVCNSDPMESPDCPPHLDHQESPPC